MLRIQFEKHFTMLLTTTLFRFFQPIFLIYVRYIHLKKENLKMQNRGMKYLLITCLAWLILGLACGNEPEPTPRPISIPQPPVEPELPEINVEFLGEKKEVRIKTLPQNNCGGNTEVQNIVKRSSSIAHTIDVGETYQVSAEGTIQVGVSGAASVSVGLGARVAKRLGYSYGSQQSISESLIVGAKRGTYVEHSIRLSETWEKGNAEIVVDGKTLEIPFTFRTDFKLELVESQELNEKCGSPMPQSTHTSVITETGALTPTATSELIVVSTAIRGLSETGTSIPTENSTLTPVTTNLPTSTATSLPTPTATSEPTPTATSEPTPATVPPISADNVKQITQLYHLGEEIATFADYIGSVAAVAFSPDGQLIASGSNDDRVRLWRVSDGTLLHTLSEHTGDVTSVAFSPDGQIVASSAQDKTVRLWQVSDGMLLHTLVGHTSIAESVAFSPDGQTLVSGGRDNTVLLWRVSDGLKLHTLEGHTGWIKNVTFSPDGQTVLSGALDNTMHLWQVNSGILQRVISVPEGAIWSMALSPDGQTLALGTRETVQLQQLSDSTPLHILPGHIERLWSIAFSPDGQLLVSTSEESTIRLWKVSDGTLLSTLEGHTPSAWVHSVAFSPDGKMLASGADDGTIRLWGVR